MENINIFLIILVVVLLIMYFLNKKERFEINDNDNYKPKHTKSNIYNLSSSDDPNQQIVDIPGKCGECTPLPTRSDPNINYNIICPQDCSNNKYCETKPGQDFSEMGILCFK
jgi:hypothetical protein